MTWVTETESLDWDIYPCSLRNLILVHKPKPTCNNLQWHLRLPWFSVRLTINSFIMGTSLLGALLSLGWLQLDITIIFLLLQTKGPTCEEPQHIEVFKHIKYRCCDYYMYYFKYYYYYQYYYFNYYYYLYPQILDLIIGSSISVPWSSHCLWLYTDTCITVFCKEVREALILLPHRNGSNCGMHSCPTWVMPGISDDALERNQRGS